MNGGSRDRTLSFYRQFLRVFFELAFIFLFRKWTNTQRPKRAARWRRRRSKEDVVEESNERDQC